MKIDITNWPDLLQHTGEQFNNWLAAVDPDALVLSVICVALVFVLRKILAGWMVGAIETLLRQFKVGLSDEVETPVKKAAEILIVTFAFFLVVEVFHLPEIAGGFLHRVLSSIAIIAVFGTWYQLSGPFAALLREENLSKVKIELDWVQRVTQFAILLFGVTSLLKVWQVDISGALTGVGVLGAGLAIAAQDLIRNLIAGMTNMSEKRFETGDAIQVEGQFLGTVKKIDLRSTLVVGFDQIPRHIPNSDLSDSVVLNYSRMQHRRVLVKVPLVRTSSREQIEAVRDGLRAYHRECGDFDVSDAAPKHIYVTELGPTSIDVLVYVWTTGPQYDKYLQVTERLTLAILKVVSDAGTDLAFPTQTIHLDAPAGGASKMPDGMPPEF